METPEQLATIYQQRFAGTASYRNAVWEVLTKEFFSQWIRPEHSVLDLGAGYGEFINNIRCREKFAMDLNPEARARLAEGIRFLHQDCSDPWDVPDSSLDVVFTSNFLEHLPSKGALRRTLDQARRCLRPRGRIICLGPNARFLHGRYWDFLDHHTVLTDRSLGEAIRNGGFEEEANIPRFLPYTMVERPRYPLFFLRLYLAMPWVWPWFGRQFLVIGQRL